MIKISQKIVWNLSKNTMWTKGENKSAIICTNFSHNKHLLVKYYFKFLLHKMLVFIELRKKERNESILK